MSDKLEPLRVFLSAFTISSLGGLAALLRSRRELTWRNILSAFLYSGVMGVVIALLWYNYFDGRGNIYFLLGVSGLAGIGGTTVVDFLVQVLKSGGIEIHLKPGDDSSEENDESAK